ncbi:redox-regulated ATPase YchF [Candidatus Peregrinibacteria bacterium RIFCSPLOWO2_02_FULL_48_14]|nr:MAG: redox-regulated ATPase YchF [Candidatus Peregrinibacteria bacterium RIFCSPLOWO2_02_FULL_48_14]
MNLQIAIVGLPNVGKSTLFNALTRSNAAQAANYPFCTIDPNVGVVEVPDPRLKALAEVCNPQKIIPAIVEFVDVAGLVKGASQGEGLGNQFLSHIRECHAVAEVIRYFKDDNVTHVHNSVDPKRDREVIEAELILADLQTLEKRIGKVASEARTGDKEKIALNALLERLKPEMESGKLALQVPMTDEEKLLLRDLHLITMKPLMILVNVGEKEVAAVNVEELRKVLDLPSGAKVIPISAKVEADLVSFSEEEAAAYLKDLGLDESGLHRVIREAYDILGLQTYFTAGEKEVRAWTVRKGALAPEAAGVIHTDFEKGFIKAEVIDWKDFVECRGEVKAREKGLLRMEGKEYSVRDGDVMHFRFAN